jgi:hypothetical protein
MHSILKNYTSQIYKEYYPYFGDLLLNFIFILNAKTLPVQTWLKTSWEAPHLILEIMYVKCKLLQITS